MSDQDAAARLWELAADDYVGLSAFREACASCAIEGNETARIASNAIGKVLAGGALLADEDEVLGAMLDALEGENDG